MDSAINSIKTWKVPNEEYPLETNIDHVSSRLLSYVFSQPIHNRVV